MAVALTSVAVLLAGCGSSSSGGVAHLGSSTASASASASSSGSGEQNSATNQKAMVAFARCMRSHGVANFPEPSEGGIHIESHNGHSSGPATSSGINSQGATFQAAQKTCGKLLPNGGAPSPQQQTKAVEAALALARCMRSHGVPNFPNPKGSGGAIGQGGLPGMNPNSPQFQAALKACQSKAYSGGVQIAAP